MELNEFLSASTPLTDWATAINFEAVDHEIATWLASEIRVRRQLSEPLDSSSPC